MNIHYVSGSRADFGLMKNCLIHLNAQSGHKVSVVVTGQHTVSYYGDTDSAIRSSG